MLVIDAANVVGSRPDGWWRDRAGAAARLVAAVDAAVSRGSLDGPVVVVLEGKARPGAPERAGGAVEVVHARGEGDDAIAALAADQVTVVTADRGLRRRVLDAGGEVVGPSWLYERID